MAYRFDLDAARRRDDRIAALDARADLTERGYDITTLRFSIERTRP